MRPGTTLFTQLQVGHRLHMTLEQVRSMSWGELRCWVEYFNQVERSHG